MSGNMTRQVNIPDIEIGHLTYSSGPIAPKKRAPTRKSIPMPVTDTTSATTTARVTNERLAELVQHLTECPHLAALDAVEHAESGEPEDALLVVARAMVELRPKRPSGRLRLRPPNKT